MLPWRLVLCGLQPVMDDISDDGWLIQDGKVPAGAGSARPAETAEDVCAAAEGAPVHVLEGMLLPGICLQHMYNGLHGVVCNTDPSLLHAGGCAGSAAERLCSLTCR